MLLSLCFPSTKKQNMKLGMLLHVRALAYMLIVLGSSLSTENKGQERDQ